MLWQFFPVVWNIVSNIYTFFKVMHRRLSFKSLFTGDIKIQGFLNVVWCARAQKVSWEQMRMNHTPKNCF